jgi:hypothetical protein
VRQLPIALPQRTQYLYEDFPEDFPVSADRSDRSDRDWGLARDCVTDFFKHWNAWHSTLWGTKASVVPVLAICWVKAATRLTWLNHGSRTAAGPSLPVQPSFVQEISGKHQQMLKRKMTSGFTQDIGYARAARVMAFGSLVCWSVSICVAEHCRTGTYPVHWQNKPLVLLAAFVKGKFSNNCVKQIGYVNRFTMLNNFALWCRCLSLGPPKIEVAWKQR